MFRKTLLACAVALPLGLTGAAPAALADADVDVHFGIPFYSYQVRPRYVHYEDYGWYDPTVILGSAAYIVPMMITLGSTGTATTTILSRFMTMIMMTTML